MDNPTGKAIFNTDDDLYGAIPAPRPAPVVPCDAEHVTEDADRAMELGWVLGTTASMEVVFDEDGLSAKHESDRTVFSTHGPEQHGDMPIPLMVSKFHSMWTVHLPEGYSALLTEPLNRPHEVFTPFSGVVDYDNFPTITHCPHRIDEHVRAYLEVGTPMFQAIPLHREGMPDEATVRVADEEEADELERNLDRTSDPIPSPTIDIEQLGE